MLFVISERRALVHNTISLAAIHQPRTNNIMIRNSSRMLPTVIIVRDVCDQANSDSDQILNDILHTVMVMSMQNKDYKHHFRHHPGQ